MSQVTLIQSSQNNSTAFLGSLQIKREKMVTNLFPPNALRVEMSTSNKANHKIHEQTEEIVARYTNSNSQAITSRIRELDREWDTERILEANASAKSNPVEALKAAKK